MPSRKQVHDDTASSHGELVAVPEFDVVSMGSATVDLFADTDSELIRIDTPSHHSSLIAFPLGSKILLDKLEALTGGGGTNTATAFARLGLKTGFLGMIGNDTNGQLIADELAAEGITFLGARDGNSGISIVLNSFAKDRAILVHKGINNRLNIADVQPFKTKWLYLSSMMEESFKTAESLVLKLNCKVAFNPSNYQAEQGYEALRGVIDHTELLICNKEELCKLLGLDPDEEISIVELIAEARTLPPAMFIITDGRRGAYLYDREHVYHVLSSKEVKVVETTGAGDAFASSFVAAILSGESKEKAMCWAVINAQAVLLYRGAKVSLLSRSDMLKQLGEDTVRVKILADEDSI